MDDCESCGEIMYYQETLTAMEERAEKAEALAAKAILLITEYLDGDGYNTRADMMALLREAGKE